MRENDSSGAQKKAHRLPHFVGDGAMNVGLRGKMLFVYLIGGFLPMALIIMMLLAQQRSTILSISKSSASHEVQFISRNMGEEARILCDVSKQLYFDDTLETIADTSFSDYTEAVGLFDKYTAIDSIVNDYSSHIASISIYIDNQTMPGNSELIRVTDDVRSSDWYEQAFTDGGKARWWYIENPSDGEHYLSLVRLIRDKERNAVGVAVLRMNMQNLVSQLSQQEGANYIMIDGEEVVSNRQGEHNDAVLRKLYSRYIGESGSEKRKAFGETCLLTYSTLESDDYENQLLILRANSYRDILNDVDSAMRTSFVLVLVCAGFSMFMIYIVSRHFSSRVSRFKNEMSRAARGERHLAKSIGGRDEIAELYNYLNTMITDIDKLTRDVYESRLEGEQLKSIQKEAQFETLASQVNPHFLFNTLETIRMKARLAGDREVEDMVKMLGKIMRHNIEVRDSLVSVRSELQIVECYLKIQHYRFASITYDIHPDPRTEKIMILPLLIQPLVENAYVHGLRDHRKGGLITVYTYLEGNIMTIKITDDGCGIEPELLEILNRKMKSGGAGNRVGTIEDRDLHGSGENDGAAAGVRGAEEKNEDAAEMPGKDAGASIGGADEKTASTGSGVPGAAKRPEDEEKRSHIGLSNVNQRIKLFYGRKYGVNIWSEVGIGTVIILTIPVWLPEHQKQEKQQVISGPDAKV